MAQIYDPVARLSELIHGLDCAVLTTVRPDGTLHSCPMASNGLDGDGALWFLTSSRTDKVEAAKTNSRVNVAFADHANQRYVSISGYCELVRDHNKTEELWDPGYGSWFAGGMEDPNLILLKITAQQVEYWDPAVRNMVRL